VFGGKDAVNFHIMEKGRLIKLLAGLFATTTTENINPHPPMTTRTGEPSASHVICKVRAIKVELVRHVSIIV